MADAYQKKKKNPNRKRTQSDFDLERLNSLPWNTSVSINENNQNGDFSLFTGSNELEGGFLSLEEIDESGFELLDIPKPAKRAKSSKQKKQTVVGEDNKTTEVTHEADGDEGETTEATAEADENKTNEDTQEADGKKKNKKRKNINKNKSKRKKKNSLDDANVPATSVVPESDSVGDVEDDEEQGAFDDPDFYAWNELRLHPSLMRALHRLGFKEPTPIQKQCIPAAAHQGKDVIGAAETGSGKTLAFGLPIMQRLLEEREKAANMREEKGEDADRYAPTGVLRALIIAPARELALQVASHLKEIATYANIKVVPIVGGISTQKQERLLKSRPEVVVGTPGRLWELMSGGEIHLVELHSLSFFVLDEADRMVEQGHFRELQSIIDMLPMSNSSNTANTADTQNCVTVSNLQRKKRQSLVFSATIGLSADFRKKLKRGLTNSKHSTDDGPSSIEMLSQRIGMRANTAIIDLTSTSILAENLEESFIECREEDKDAHLYYILSLHGKGRTIVFCTSIAALRHISSILRILGVEVWTLHAQMQQRARLKAVDRFRGSEHGILIATDIAARGLDIPGVRTVIHYQLPHAAEVYVHRGGRTARAYADGCSIALISPNDKSKFASLCRSFSKESFQRFPMESSYLPAIMKRLSLARQIDKFSRKDSQDKAEKNWLARSAESLDVDMEEADSEEERVNAHKKNKAKSNQLKKLQQDLNALLARPLQSNVFSHRYLAGAGLSPLVQHQFEELARNRNESLMNPAKKKTKMVVIGQDFVEPLQALRSGGQEVRMVVDTKEIADKQKALVDIRRKRKEEKKRSREQRRKQRRKHDRDEEN